MSPSAARSAPTAALLALLVSLSAALSVSSSLTNSSILLHFKTARDPTTVPAACLFNAECGPNLYCTATWPFTFGVCKPLGSIGMQCNSNYVSCIAGALCHLRLEVCRRKPGRNEVCYFQRISCLPGFVCTPPRKNGCVSTPCYTGRCLPKLLGKAGATCQNDNDCDENGGFYCKTKPGVCMRKKPAGAECDGEYPVDNECQGFCSGNICIAKQPLGGLCSKTVHCTGQIRNDPYMDPITCNRPDIRNAVGVCAKASQLKWRLGAPCNPKRDLCDVKRGLRCRWAPLLKSSVCQHHLDPGLIFPFCTPGSPLGRCPGPRQFFPTECRLRRIAPDEQVAQGLNNFTACRPKPRLLRPGQICSDEAVMCQPGSVCRIIPGLLPRPQRGSERTPPPPTSFCVVMLKFGSKCDYKRKFRELCPDGMRCVKGTCMKGSGKVKKTHAANEAPCGRLPCAPGLVCGDNDFCKKPKPVVGLGRLCGGPFEDEAQCVKGLVCRTEWNPRGFKRCRWPMGVGAYCETDSWCAGKLMCPLQWSREESLELHEMRCYDPAKSLWLGQRCDPNKQISGPRCATVQDGSPFYHLPLSCLRKGMLFVCQVEVGPFGMCDLKKNRTCSDSRFECRANVCMPKN